MTVRPLVPFGAQALVPPPYRCAGTRLWAFVAEADEQRLQALCTRVFSAPTDGGVVCEPIGRFVVLTFGRVASITSQAPGYADDGTIEEAQACVWMPVRVDGRLAVFVPYLIVDNPMSLVAGREVFGYPKSWGWIDLPGDPGVEGDAIAVDVYGGMFGPDQERGRRPLLRVRRRDDSVPAPVPARAPGASALERALGHLAAVTGLDALVKRLEHTDPVLARVDQVFFKQVLDITGAGAALQEVGQAPLAVEHFGGHPLVHLWDLEVDPLDSHPVTTELGLCSQTLYGGFFVDRLDFVLEAGRVLWSPAAGGAPAQTVATAVDTALAARIARRRVEAVRDDPAGRYALAREFYEQRPLAAGGAAYGRGELAFIRWEIDRGVLDPVHGSAWWRAVNLGLLADGAEAAALADVGLPESDTSGLRPEVAAWLSFFRAPTPSSWYQAHNTSIISGYLRHADLAAREETAELVLVNMVLARVLFAQVLATDPKHALGHLGRLTRFLGDPRSDAVGVVVALPDLYPRHYPLTAHDRRRVEHRDWSPIALAGDVIDDEIITHQLGRLFTWAAGQLAEPRLVDLAHDGVADYPWPLLPADQTDGRTREVRRPSAVTHLLRTIVASPA